MDGTVKAKHVDLKSKGPAHPQEPTVMTTATNAGEDKTRPEIDILTIADYSQQMHAATVQLYDAWMSTLVFIKGLESMGLLCTGSPTQSAKSCCEGWFTKKDQTKPTPTRDKTTRRRSVIVNIAPQHQLSAQSTAHLATY